MGQERLDKLLASRGGLPQRRRPDDSRRPGAGDSRVCRSPAEKADGALQEIRLDGAPLSYSRHVYIMLNKPPGLLCVSRDPKAATVMDLLPPALRRPGLFPAGRLDKDTVGLVLITDDGDFAHRMLSPRRHVEKRYLARLDGRSPGNISSGSPRGQAWRMEPAVFRHFYEWRRTGRSRWRKFPSRRVNITKSSGCFCL